MAGDERARLFCTLQLDDDIIRLLSAWQREQLPAGRVVPAENLHVTLAFLGSRPVSDVPGIISELRAVADAARPLELRPVSYRETRSVGMLVLDDPDLKELRGAVSAVAADLQGRLEQLGVYRRERRRWLPHVSVVRFRESEGLAPDLANMCSIHVVRAALYRSFLGAGGARYEVVQTEVLGGR